jgi:glyoxylate reductase
MPYILEKIQRLGQEDMSKPRVFVTRIIRDYGLDKVKAFCDAEIWQDELPPSREVLLQKVHGVDGILSLLTDRMDGELMDAAGPQLKVISNHAVGFDNVDIPAATARRIPIGNTPGILTDATADLAFALIMAAGRRVVEGSRFVRDGKWKTWGPSLMLGIDFVGSTLGIIGFGRIGRAVAKRALGFEMRVIYFDPLTRPDPSLNATPVDMDTLLHEADIISVHAPLTPETHHLINAKTLAKMKPGAVLVNTSRGPVVDQQALYEALKEHRIFAAGLDVTDPEPLPMDNPLHTLDNCIIVPHIASASTKSRDMMAYLAAENLIAGLKGERLPNCINPQVYNE